MIISQRSCYSSRLFRRCQDLPVGLCQYCGRPFCPRHGDLLEEEQQVCHRQRCQKKVADLKAHVAYVSWVSLRNKEKICGVAGCDREPWGQCSHCQGLFCSPHVHPRMRTSRRERGPTREPVSLCDHCWHRHDLWTKV